MRQYVVKNIAGSGAKWLDVAPGRFPGWVTSFGGRHGAGPDAPLGVAVTSADVTFTAPDGAVAECHPPFPPVPGLAAGLAAGPGGYAEAARAVADHAMRPRTVGVLLVRLGGYAAGVFTGSPPRLADWKTGSRPVHGRSAAGGWSQQRFARRREKQAGEALQAAADAAVMVFSPWGGDSGGRRGVSRERSGDAITARGGDARSRREPQLDAVVLGGDKRAIADLAGDQRLAPYLALATGRFLTVPDPRRAVLEDAPRLFLAVRIRLTEPAP